MAGTFPRYRLYASNGSTLIYEFDYVQEDNGAFTDPSSFIEYQSLRGQGSIISEGSEESFDINLNFVLKGTDYADLVSQMNTLISTVDKFTAYILKIDLTNSTTQSYNVKRILPIQWVKSFQKNRVNLQKGIITLRSGSW